MVWVNITYLGLAKWSTGSHLAAAGTAAQLSSKLAKLPLLFHGSQNTAAWLAVASPRVVRQGKARVPMARPTSREKAEMNGGAAKGVPDPVAVRCTAGVTTPTEISTEAF